MQKQEIKKLSDIEHVLLRSGMYVGSTIREDHKRIIINDDKFEISDISYVPALLKIIYEIIDNSIDEGVRTNFQFANKIEIEITDDSVKVKDNGRGIPVEKKYGKYAPELVWTELRAGSNFEGDRNSIGTNGVGSSLTNIFSRYFRGTTSDGVNKCIVECNNNMNKINTTVSPSKKQYTEVFFNPDLSKFGVDKIDDIHMNLIKQRLIFLSLQFPIKFILNREEIKFNKSHEEFCKMFSENFVLLKEQDYFAAVGSSDNFEQYLPVSMVNGLELFEGSHIDYVEEKIIYPIKDALSKKCKGIAATDIKNNLFIILFMRNYKNMDFNSQTKEVLKVNKGSLNEYFNQEFFDKLVKKIMKCDEIIEPIKSAFDTKLQIKKMQEVKRQDKKIKKKEKPSKLIEANSRKRDKCELFLCEGDSAKTNFIPTRDTEYQACFPLRGKPLNSFEKSITEIYSNKEIKEVLSIIGVGLIDLAVEFLGWTDKFYSIVLKDGYKCIVNEADEVLIDNKFVKVKNIEKDSIKSIEPYTLQLKEFTIDKDRIKRTIIKNNMRYGKIFFLTDADVDGNAISGLLLALFSKYFPELFEGEFVYRIKSPLYIVNKSKTETLRFFNSTDYEEFLNSCDKKYPTRYAKGLGSLSLEDYRMIITDDICRELFKYNSIIDLKTINMAFGKTEHARILRKKWLTN